MKTSRLVIEWNPISDSEKRDFTPWVKRLRAMLPEGGDGKGEDNNNNSFPTDRLGGWEESDTDSTQSFQTFANSKMKEFEQGIKKHLSTSTAELVNMDKDCSAVDRSLFSSVAKWIVHMYNSTSSEFSFHLRRVDATSEHPTGYWIFHIGNFNCHQQAVLRNFIREFGVRLIDLNVDFNQQRLETIWVDSSVLNPFLWETFVSAPDSTEDSKRVQKRVRTESESSSSSSSSESNSFFGGIVRKIKHRFSKRYNPMA